MDETENVNDSKGNESTRDQFAKLILATAAGFIVSKVVENAYTSFVQKRRESTNIENQ